MARLKTKAKTRSAALIQPIERKKVKIVKKADIKRVITQSNHETVVSSPEGIRTWGDAINKVMKNYSEAWQRLAKR